MELRKAVPISTIKLGHRVRKDYGDIATLWQSIQAVGLIHPVVVNSQMELISGARRLKAYIIQNKKSIDVLVCDALDDITKALQAERDENTCRKNFTPSEMVAMVKKLDEREREAAKERKKAGKGEHGGGGRGNKKPSENFTEGLSHESPPARDRIAKAVGTSGVTYERAKKVVKAAEEDPETYGDLVEKMDATGKVNPAYEDYRARKNGGTKTPRKNKDGQRKAGLSLPPGKAEELRKQLKELRRLINKPQIQLSPISMRLCMDKIETIIF